MKVLTHGQRLRRLWRRALVCWLRPLCRDATPLAALFPLRVCVPVRTMAADNDQRDGAVREAAVLRKPIYSCGAGGGEGVGDSQVVSIANESTLAAYGIYRAEVRELRSLAVVNLAIIIILLAGH